MSPERIKPITSASSGLITSAERGVPHQRARSVTGVDELELPGEQKGRRYDMESSGVGK